MSMAAHGMKALTHGQLRKGHLEVLNSGHANGCLWDKDTCGAGEKNGYNTSEPRHIRGETSSPLLSL